MSLLACTWSHTRTRTSSMSLLACAEYVAGFIGVLMFCCCCTFGVHRLMRRKVFGTSSEVTLQERACMHEYSGSLPALQFGGDVQLGLCGGGSAAPADPADAAGQDRSWQCDSHEPDKKVQHTVRCDGAGGAAGARPKLAAQAESAPSIVQQAGA